MARVERALDRLGPDVEITNRRIPQDMEFKRRLKGIGKAMEQMVEGATYAGSLATHIYTNELGAEVRFIHHHGFDKPVTEEIISTAVADQAAHLMEDVFGRKKLATRDPRDKRMKQ